MHIEDYLNYNDDAFFLPTLNIKINTAQVSISYWGERIVTFNQMEGSTTLDNIVNKYFQSEVFQVGLRPSLLNRASAIGLWDKLNDLYERSNTILNNSYVYKYLVPLREINMNPRKWFFPYLMNKADQNHVFRSSLFDMSYTELTTNWPWDICIAKAHYIYVDGHEYKTYSVKEESVIEFCKTRYPQLFSISYEPVDWQFIEDAKQIEEEKTQDNLY